MSIWDKIISVIKNTDDTDNAAIQEENSGERPQPRYAFVDVEVSPNDRKINDIGAIRYDGAKFHQASVPELMKFLRGVDFVCGHNLIHHDATYLFPGGTRLTLVDTLYLSPLLFPERPYHKLLKDDKLVVDQLNNPVNDCQKAADLLFDEITEWHSLPGSVQTIFASLLRGKEEFDGFLRIVDAKGINRGIADRIRTVYSGKICQNADVEFLIRQYPCELAYALALIGTDDYRSTTPAWVLMNYPHVEYIVDLLCRSSCETGCAYCNSHLDIHRRLKDFFGYDEFRTYEGEALQEKAVEAAVSGKSLLAIFPTGGGKSLTFQLPALMDGRTAHGLTVVISPLQSLMKDQVDNLANRGISDAVTINGTLDPITRAQSIRQVMEGDASILYIAPEMLRSKTIERILTVRHVVRFVIDEAHCFSSWGQDFRVDYLYIGKFIRQYQEKKRCKTPIPVSCFTATAKQKVIQDICDYFRETLNLELDLFASKAARTNLRYAVIHTENEDSKYQRLRELVSGADCPTIVYVSRTRRTEEIARKLNRDGYSALPFHGKMPADEKIANQDSFMNDRTRIIVATSAFGMGVDKKDVGLVIHYDISDSLENYIQEAGRAGRDPSLDAKCYVLYSDNDLDRHFILLNQTKLSISEIQQIWKAVKDLTRKRMRVCCSALEIARQAGWDDSVHDIETRVRTALSALEQGGYLVRGNNVPHVYATGITVKNLTEARERIEASKLFGSEETEQAVRIIKSLISKKYIAKAQGSDAESRIDYLADILGMTKREIIASVDRMRAEGILADSRDISAYLMDAGDTERRSRMLQERFAKLEQFLLDYIPETSFQTSYKQINEEATNAGIAASTEKNIRTLLHFLSIQGWIFKKEDAARNLEIRLRVSRESLRENFNKRIFIGRFTLEWLYQTAGNAEDRKIKDTETGDRAVRFSVVELLEEIRKNPEASLFGTPENICLEDVEDALLYLTRIGALKLEGGFLVLYNAMDIRRIKDSKSRYRQDDYRMLNEFYRQKIQQVHIVGEYANLMVRDYGAALQYVQDYFQMDYRKFIQKYFRGERAAEIQRNLTPEKYKQLFGQLSDRQMEIISDKSSRCIVVAAGPGSGKTRVLVHKLASLLLLEDVKHEQLLMLTFSRAAATEFKQRLMELIGNAAHFVEIKTFHSYCFDLLGRIGSLEEAQDVVGKAAEMIRQGEVEQSRIGKTVLVIDEAQDMSESEFALVTAMMADNEEMRVIAVGDDDQNIYEFRGSDSAYMFRLRQGSGDSFVEMTENYRSSRHLVRFANEFARHMGKRMKTTPILPMRKETGRVKVTVHRSKEMYIPLIQDLQNNRHPGTSCILTQTNEEAAILMGLLNRCGISAKLIQSMDGLRFRNLAEMRYFLNFIHKNGTGPQIQDELWERAKQATVSVYRSSQCLKYVLRCLELFESTNRCKYAGDFREFVNESELEDFCEISGSDVVVSTIHKSKGKEFNNVYLMIASNGQPVCDSLMRRYYVAVTRAKDTLSIHTDSSFFNGLHADSRETDNTLYTAPQEIVLQLTHRDVYLDFFKNIKRDVLALRSGDRLHFQDKILYDGIGGKPVAHLSQKMLSTLAEWAQKGYRVTSASVRFVVAWKPKDAPKTDPEIAVLLPDLILRSDAQ